jgi:hypothetical protein
MGKDSIKIEGKVLSSFCARLLGSLASKSCRFVTVHTPLIFYERVNAVLSVVRRKQIEELTKAIDDLI